MAFDSIRQRAVRADPGDRLLGAEHFSGESRRESRQPPVVCKQTVVDQSSGDLIYQSPDIIIDATRKVVDEARSRK
jgi:hypothetical protein